MWGVDPSSLLTGAVNTVSSLSPVFAAVAGGFIGAWASGRIRDREAKKAQTQEGKGLIRLIDDEVRYNYDKLLSGTDEQAYTYKISVINWPPPLFYLKMEDWDRVKVRLTQLRPADHVDALVEYYLCIRQILETVKTVSFTLDLPDFVATIEAAISKGEAVSRLNRDYLTNLPDHDGDR